MMQELKPTMDDLGLKTVEEYGLNMVEEWLRTGLLCFFKL